MSKAIPTRLIERPVVRQFIKFCVVGGSSFVIDAGLHRILMFNITIDGQLLSQIVGMQLLQWFNPGASSPDAAANAAFAAFKVFSAGIAILNSFIWNRFWTFRIRGKEDRMVQLTKFVAVSLVGMVLNVVISSAVNSVLRLPEKESWAIATVVAAAVVAVWNFTGQKLWAFKRGDP
ncbi:MAG: GtrA family protein [Fimbriimonadaceae bacterium]